ncbi:hypothetical protein QCA50_011212 [Cerrena zonata]|uniref:Sister chromatid cohesion protein DCC1 n=1 Tax=Cerrena zonata TaxID=2478898 RepID=A0AAW0G3Z2_9APHY
MPRVSKKRKTSNEGVSARAGEKPSDTLRMISSKVPADSLPSLLEKYLYPALDELSPEAQQQIIERLDLAQEDIRVAELRGLIKYNVHEKSLNTKVKLFLKDVKCNSDDEYEEQGDIMMEIASEILKWLPNLWQIGIEKALDVQLVHKCLVLCTTVIEEVEQCDSPVDFRDFDDNITILNSSGRVIYKDKANAMQFIAWMWRELLVSVGSKKGSTKAILADIDRFNIKEEICDYLGYEDEQMDGSRSQMAHWTPKMRDIATTLLYEQH